MISSELVEGRAPSRPSIYAMYIAGVSGADNELIHSVMTEGYVPFAQLGDVIETMVGYKQNAEGKGRERVVSGWRIEATGIKPG